MVFDYISHEKYELNFEELADVIRTNALLICHSDKEISFFDNWIKLLHDAYKQDSVCVCQSKNSDQIFQKEIYLGNQKVLL